MIGEFEVLDEKTWIEEIYSKIEGNKYIAHKISEAQIEEQNNNKSNGGIWNTLKNYITKKVMAWDGVEFIDEDDINLGRYEDLLITYLEIGDRCIPIKHYDDERHLGLQIMDSPGKKKEFIAEHRYEQMKNFV